VTIALRLRSSLIEALCGKKKKGPAKGPCAEGGGNQAAVEPGEENGVLRTYPLKRSGGLVQVNWP
jgi:hypothetical protein